MRRLSGLLTLNLMAGMTLTACAQSGPMGDTYPPAGALPLQIAVAEGGFLGSSLRFTGDSETLTLEIYPPGQGEPDEVYRAEPTDKAWDAFRLALIDARLSDWQSEYNDFNVLDGTQWSVAIDYPEWQIRSSGSNAWPDDDRFRVLWDALVVLVEYPDSKVR